MNIALTSTELNFILETVVAPLLQLGAKVFVFGSRASCTNAPYSDLDLLIRCEESDQIKMKLAEISEILENSNFPYKVDLVLEDEVASSYKDSILNSMKPLV